MNYKIITKNAIDCEIIKTHEKENKYEATLVQNKRTPHLLGTKAITGFSLKNGYLEMITHYPKPDNASPGHVTKIESALIRE